MYRAGVFRTKAGKHCSVMFILYESSGNDVVNQWGLWNTEGSDAYSAPCTLLELAFLQGSAYDRKRKCQIDVTNTITVCLCEELAGVSHTLVCLIIIVCIFIPNLDFTKNNDVWVKT